MDFHFDLFQILSAFIVLFAVVDPLGSIPIILNLEHKGIKVNAAKVTLWSLALMLIFFFLGDWVLHFFGVDIRSFAVAGSIILFLMALEMLLDIEIFKNNGPEDAGSIVPLAFPLFAGPAVFTTLLTIPQPVVGYVDEPGRGVSGAAFHRFYSPRVGRDQYLYHP